MSKTIVVNAEIETSDALEEIGIDVALEHFDDDEGVAEWVCEDSTRLAAILEAAEQDDALAERLRRQYQPRVRDMISSEDRSLIASALAFAAADAARFAALCGDAALAESFMNARRQFEGAAQRFLVTVGALTETKSD